MYLAYNAVASRRKHTLYNETNQSTIVKASVQMISDVYGMYSLILIFTSLDLGLKLNVMESKIVIHRRQSLAQPTQSTLIFVRETKEK